MEFKAYPAIQYDDMLDCQSRVLDDEMMVVWPRPVRSDRDVYDREEAVGSDSWMAG